MKTELYYTITKKTDITLDFIEECTGWKNIMVYEIANDKPKFWFEVEAKNEENSEEIINSWLFENGFGSRDYKLINL